MTYETDLSAKWHSALLGRGVHPMRAAAAFAEDRGDCVRFWYGAYCVEHEKPAPDDLGGLARGILRARGAG